MKIAIVFSLVASAVLTSLPATAAEKPFADTFSAAPGIGLVQDGDLQLMRYGKTKR